MELSPRAGSGATFIFQPRHVCEGFLEMRLEWSRAVLSSVRSLKALFTSAELCVHKFSEIINHVGGILYRIQKKNKLTYYYILFFKIFKLIVYNIFLLIRKSMSKFLPFKIKETEQLLIHFYPIKFIGCYGK